MEILNKAKNIINTASEKTGEFIYDQKCNIQIAKVCAELKKSYEKLGRLCYKKIKDLKMDDNEFEAVVEKIEFLKGELAALRESKVDYGEEEVIKFEDDEPVGETGNESASEQPQEAE